MNRPFEALIKRFTLLEGIHGLYDKAEAEVVGQIGLPICMLDCGKCCEHNTVLAWGIEVELIASHLLSDAKLLDRVMNKCEEWLTDNPGRVFSVKQLKSNPAILMQRSHELVTGRCPLLDHTACMIHTVRPVSCRAFGVTTYPRGCSRPAGFGENMDRRAYNTGMAAPIQQAFNDFLVECSGVQNDVAVGFLPTLLMSRLRSQRFTGLVDSGQIDPVKLVKNLVHSPSILVESQFTDLTLAGDTALQEIEKKGIPTGPLTVLIK